MFKRILTVSLILVMMLGALAGCKFGKTENEDSSSDSVADVTESLSEERGGDDDTIGSYDFGGAEFTILTRKDTKYEFGSDKGLGGDVLDRAIYKRNYNVSTRFNATIKIVDKSGGWEQRDEFLSTVRAEAMGGDGGYDLVSTHSVYLGWMTVEGLATDMAALNEMNFSKAWWNQNLYDEININGHVYFMLGDICATTYEYMQVLYVNEFEFEENFSEIGIDYLYELVEKGKWTWEQMMNYALEYGTKGNDEVTEYGFVTNIHAWRASFATQDTGLYTRDENGDFMIHDAAPDKLIKVVNEMVDFYSKENIYFFTAQWDTGANVLNKEFSGGNALFYSQTLNEASKLASSMNSDHMGVIPVPKYDEYQEKYYTICRNTVSAVMIIETSKNKEMAGVLTEALCMESYNVVTPEYYEIVLKNRYFSSDKYSKILDMIRDGLTIYVVECYIENAASPDTFLDQVKNGRSGEVASAFENAANSMRNKIGTFYSNLKKDGLY